MRPRRSVALKRLRISCLAVSSSIWMIFASGRAEKYSLAAVLSSPSFAASSSVNGMSFAEYGKVMERSRVVEFESGILRRPRPAKTRMSSVVPAADICAGFFAAEFEARGRLFPNVIRGAAFEDRANPIMVPIINKTTIAAEIIRSVRFIFRWIFSSLRFCFSTGLG